MNRITIQSRRGFTLVELLIVIAIVALLTSFAGMVVMRTITGSRIAGTKVLMTKIQRQLQTRAEAVIRASRSQQTNPQCGDATSIQTLANSASGRSAQVRAALFAKAYMRSYLPQTWSEAAFLTARINYTPPSTPNPKTESAEVLYFFLTNGTVVGVTPANDDVFKGNEVRDTDGNGAPELVDSWGKPVAFFRWPTRLLRPGGYAGMTRVSDADFLRAQILIQGIPNTVKLAPAPGTPGSFNQDPDDPIAVLAPAGPGGVLVTASNAADFESGTGSFAPIAFHTPFTWHTPLVVSAGQDGLFGIYGFDEIPPPSGHFGRLCEPYITGIEETYLNDNITNVNVRSGGN